MKVAVFSCKPYDKRTFLQYNKYDEISLHFFECRLSEETVSLAQGFDAVSCFVNDQLNESVLKQLKEYSIDAISLRCAGYNNVSLDAAKKYNIRVYHVPDYSPESVAEHAVALILTLNRKTHRAYNRVKDGNFSLEGLMGFNLADKTVGCIGTGRIGQAFINIMQGFGCKILAYDTYQNPNLSNKNVKYASIPELYANADIISLHCPLTEDTHHLIDKESLANMKDGVMIINTSRGALVDVQSAVDALYTGKVGYLGLDVYEDEGSIFFEDMSNKIIHDSVFQLLLTFPNVIVTGHQGYFTDVALTHIAETALENLHIHKQGIENTRRLA